jgi:Mn2+/Fe2+ NRAMP family transporter
LQEGASLGIPYWVLLMSNIMALSSKFKCAISCTQRDLAQASRETYSPFINYILYFLAEVAIAACDLAEVRNGDRYKSIVWHSAY